MDKLPRHIIYIATSPLSTILAHLIGKDNGSASRNIFSGCDNKEDVMDTIKTIKETGKAGVDFTYTVVSDDVKECREICLSMYEGSTLPRILEILTIPNTPDYWAINVAWEHVEHDLWTEHGISFIDALLESKAYGTETEDENQMWNALWQLNNIGTIACLALAAAYRRGVVDTIPFYEYVKNTDASVADLT